ncbi:MAG: hypothetical protein L0312_24670, partial [Acidobacteria bacterium]|nr:hypothetical protein [Acidobacteriota bacterium]
TPEDVGAKVRAAGGVPDDQVLGDLDGALKFLRSQPRVGKKVGVFGFGFKTVVCQTRPIQFFHSSSA